MIKSILLWSWIRDTGIQFSQAGCMMVRLGNQLASSAFLHQQGYSSTPDKARNWEQVPSFVIWKWEEQSITTFYLKTNMAMLYYVLSFPNDLLHFLIIQATLATCTNKPAKCNWIYTVRKTPDNRIGSIASLFIYSHCTFIIYNDKEF